MSVKVYLNKKNEGKTPSTSVEEDTYDEDMAYLVEKEEDRILIETDIPEDVPTMKLSLQIAEADFQISNTDVGAFRLTAKSLCVNSIKKQSSSDFSVELEQWNGVLYTSLNEQVSNFKIIDGEEELNKYKAKTILHTLNES